MFDTYTLKARVYPIVILLFPILMIGLFYSFEFNSFLPLGSSALISGAFSYLFSQLGRDKGKNKEAELWQHWGGMPSVQLLRLSNQAIDKHTKQRYHKKLLSLCPVNATPNEWMEENTLAEADEIYKTWSAYLRSKTRDTKVYSLLFKDNCSYGFRRNMWGLKSIAIQLIILLLAGNFVLGFYKTKSINPLLYGHGVQYCIVGLLLMLSFWLFVVSKKWVRLPAFSYAERLCEATETL